MDRDTTTQRVEPGYSTPKYSHKAKSKGRALRDRPAVSFEDHDKTANGTSTNVIDACYANESIWEPESPTRFERCTNCGILRVERMRPDSWAAYRDDCELRNCRHQQAIFSTRQQAQSAADMHAGDRYPNSNRADGGVHWSEQSNSHYVPRVARQPRTVSVARSSDDPITIGESHYER